MTPTDVAGRPAMLIERRDNPRYLDRTLITHAAWGDLLELSSSGTPDTVPTAGRMQAMLSSATRATTAEWDGLVTEARGGPGLHPDAGNVELARGRAPGHELSWLLQAVPGRGGHGGSVDPCLRLSNGLQACAFTSITSGGPSDPVIQTFGGPDGGGPETATLGEFVVIAVARPAPAVRVTVGNRHAGAPLHPVPGSRLSGTVVFLDGVANTMPTCPGGPDPATSGLKGMTVQLLDARSAPVGCID